MRSSFGARRKPRKVGQNEEEDVVTGTRPSGLSKDEQGKCSHLV